MLGSAHGTIDRVMMPPMRFELAAGAAADHMAFHEIHHRATRVATLRRASVDAEPGRAG
jgi:hypothetical protein